MPSSIAAAKACARTMLFHNLAINAFSGAVPHVVLMVDKHPSVLQKVLVEGYLRAMEEYNAQDNEFIAIHNLENTEALLTAPPPPPPPHHHLLNKTATITTTTTNNNNDNNTNSTLSDKSRKLNDNDNSSLHCANEFTHLLSSEDEAANGKLLIPLQDNVCTPCGSVGLNHTMLNTQQQYDDVIGSVTSDVNLCKQCRITCSLVPFEASTFLDDMRRLQHFFRLCGYKSSSETENSCLSLNECNNVKDECDDNEEMTNMDNEKSYTIFTNLNNNRTTNEMSSKSDVMSKMFEQEFNAVRRFLQPLHDNNNNNTNNNNNNSNNNNMVVSTSGSSSFESLCNTLKTGPRRELLGFILIQQSAFQNEMKKYRLRLTLFDMGMRVAEHCHLESMSAPADALAHEGKFKDALEDDQIYTYGRCCAVEPRTMEILAKAIADAIDTFAWKRSSRMTEENNDTNSSSSSSSLPPPESLIAAWNNETLWEWFDDNSLCWSGFNKTRSKNMIENGHNVTNDTDDESSSSNNINIRGTALKMNEYLSQPIIGPGEPLQIICQDQSKVLMFTGGLEDCLMNTGFYVATTSKQRNDVEAHRRRFISDCRLEKEIETIDNGTSVCKPVMNNDKEGEDNFNRENRQVSKCIDANDNIDDMKSEKANVAKVQPLYGRLKKEEYLAMKKARKLGAKQNDANISFSSFDNNNDKKESKDSDAEEQTENVTSDVRHMEEDGIIAGSCINSSIGGTFPIGEVITEAFDLSQLNGMCDVFAYPDPDKNVAMCKPSPFVMTIENGVVAHISSNAPPDMHELLSLVRQAENNKCYIRELGIGLNPFVGPKHMLSDVTSFERQWGIHLSLGLRHPLFVKQRAKRNRDGSKCNEVIVKGPVVKRKAGKYHIDVFIDVAFLKIGSFTIDFTKPLKVV